MTEKQCQLFNILKILQNLVSLLILGLHFISVFCTNNLMGISAFFSKIGTLVLVSYAVFIVKITAIWMMPCSKLRRPNRHLVLDVFDLVDDFYYYFTIAF